MNSSVRHALGVALGSSVVAKGLVASPVAASAAAPQSDTGAPLAAGVGSAFSAGAGLGLVLVIVVLAWWYMTSKRKSRNQRSRYAEAQARYADDGPPPPADIADLRAEAGSLLVSTDDVIAQSEQELAFAQAQFGDEQIRPFQTAINQAKVHMRRSFQLQKQLDDEIPDSEEDQRSWLTEIIQGCHSAQESLKKQEKNFTELRQLERNAPDAINSLTRSISALRDDVPTWEQEHHSLLTDYSPDATDSVADNLRQATDRLDFADHAVSGAQSSLDDGNSSEAVVRLRAGEEAMSQARALLEAIGHSRDELRRADGALAEATAQAKTDLAEARSLMERGTFADLAGSTASVETVVTEIEAERARGPIDPLTLSRRLSESRQELDRGLESVRNQNERDRAARETLAHTMLSAQARLTSASDYVRARRGGVQAQARTRLGEAERNLEEAEKMRLSDPSGALNHANQAIRLAEDAQRIAVGDVDDFSRRGYGHGNNGSAALGGILFGTGYGRSGPPGGFGGPGMGGPGFGGGFTGQGL